MQPIDTTQNNPHPPHITSTNRVIAIGRSGYTPRYTYVYNPSAEARAWDGADARTTHCIGSIHGFYSFVQIKVTGRADRWDVPGIDGPARKLRITVNLGTEDEETVDAWLIGGGDSI